MDDFFGPSPSAASYADTAATFLLDQDIPKLRDKSKSDTTLQFYSDMVKRTFDIAGSFMLIVALSPVLLLIAFAVACDGGPAIFPHRRVGRGGQAFHCLKFRTMVVNSEEALHKLMKADSQAEREWNDNRKLRKDPRVTRVGALLRKTSLDELPQLVNVLRGEMSLVGPRPIVTQEVVRYSDSISFYYSVRPGLTGLWQVSGRSETSFDERVGLDVQYVKYRSTKNDLKILLKTLPSVVCRRGAF